MCSFDISSTSTLLYKVTWYQNDVQKYVTDYADTTQLASLRLTENIFSNNGFQLGTEVISLVIRFNTFVHLYSA